MFPSCGWSHCNTLVGTVPRFKRPISCRPNRSRSMRVVGQGRDHQTGTKRIEQFGDGHVEHAHKREQVFLVGQRLLEILTVNHRRQQVRAAFELDQALRSAETGRHVLGAALGQPALDRRVNTAGRVRIGEGGQQSRHVVAHLGTISARRWAKASANSRPCAGVRMLDALTHERPPLDETEVTIRSRYSRQAPAVSGPSSTLL